MHINKRDAEAEALRIAAEFVAAEVNPDTRFAWELTGAVPASMESGYKERKTVIKWSVVVNWIPKDGGVMDGPSILLVNIKTKETKWMGFC